MKIDISHHGKLLNLIFAKFCQIFSENARFWIRKPVFPKKSGKIWQNSGLTGYHDAIYHFSYSNHGKFIFGTQCAIWRIFLKFAEEFFKMRIKIIKYPSKFQLAGVRRFGIVREHPNRQTNSLTFMALL